MHVMWVEELDNTEIVPCCTGSGPYGLSRWEELHGLHTY